MLYCVQLVKERDSRPGDPKKTGFAADPETHRREHTLIG
jgi:hypothetical protein